jgi:hypothetical protein
MTVDDRPKARSNGGLSFLIASLMKIASSGAGVILFPMIAVIFNATLSSQLATIVSVSTLSAVVMRAGLDQYIARTVVYYGLMSRQIGVLLSVLIVWASVCFYSVGFIFEISSYLPLMMASLLVSATVSALCTGAGLGIASVVCSSAIPIFSYHFSIFFMYFNKVADASYFILWSSASIAFLSIAAVFYLLTRHNQRKLTYDAQDKRDIAYFSLITISRVMRNEAPTIIASIMFPSWAWFVSFSQRLINVFPSIQAVINVFFFTNAFKSLTVTRFPAWRAVIIAWFLVYISGLGGYYIYFGDSLLSGPQIISTLFAGFCSGYILRYGSLGITMIATGRISQFFWSLIITILASLILSGLGYLLFEEAGYVMIVPAFSSTLMLLYVFWGRYVH